MGCGFVPVYADIEPRGAASDEYGCSIDLASFPRRGRTGGPIADASAGTSRPEIPRTQNQPRWFAPSSRILARSLAAFATDIRSDAISLIPVEHCLATHAQQIFS